jgi:hypothetical protein
MKNTEGKKNSVVSKKTAFSSLSAVTTTNVMKMNRMEMNRKMEDTREESNSDSSSSLSSDSEDDIRNAR